MMRKAVKTGIVRSKFELFVACKDTLRKSKQSRFSRRTSSKPLADENSLQNKGLLNKQSVVEMSTMTSLPPEWVDKYEDCQIMLKEVDNIKKQISSLYTRRLNALLSETQESRIDREIFEKAQEATKKISFCEKLVKQIRNTLKQDSPDKQVCQNLIMGLAVQIQQKTRQVRGQQRVYVEQRKRIQNSTKVSFLQLAVEKTLQGTMYQDELQQMQMQDLQLQTRNKQILKLVDTINQLSEIYKQLSDMVILQGTLLDRIDVNLDMAVEYVKKGKDELGKALQHQKSPLACRMILVMITILVILGIILIVKHSR